MKDLKNKKETLVTLVCKFGKYSISADKALKAKFEPLYKQAEKQNEENIAEHTIQQTLS